MKIKITKNIFIFLNFSGLIRNVKVNILLMMLKDSFWQCISNDITKNILILEAQYLHYLEISSKEYYTKRTPLNSPVAN